MKRAVAYLRVSTDHQEIHAQRAAIERWLQGNGFAIATGDWYVDKATGASLARPEFMRLQEGIWNGEVGHVIMYALDRFARNMIDGLGEIDRWQKARVRLTFVADMLDFELGTWAGDMFTKIMVAVKLAIGEQERIRMKQRITTGIVSAKQLQEQAIQLHETGHPSNLIARQLGIPVERVNKMLRPGGGLWARQRDGRTRVDINHFITLLNAGVSRRGISAATGLGITAVTDLARRIAEGRTVQQEISVIPRVELWGFRATRKPSEPPAAAEADPTDVP